MKNPFKEVKIFLNRFYSPVAMGGIIFSPLLALAAFIPAVPAFIPIVVAASFTAIFAAVNFALYDFEIECTRKQAEFIVKRKELKRKLKISSDDEVGVAVRAQLSKSAMQDLVKGENKERFSESLAFIEATADWITLAVGEVSALNAEIKQMESKYGQQNHEAREILRQQRNALGAAQSDFAEAISLLKNAINTRAKAELDSRSRLRLSTALPERPPLETVTNEVEIDRSTFEELNNYEKLAKTAVKKRELA